MLSNIKPTEELTGLARAKGRDYTTLTVHPADVPERIEQGWSIDKRSKRSVRLKRPKPQSTLLEDRVWTLFYRMGFTHLSDRGGGRLAVDSKRLDGPQNLLDVVALDGEVALAVECKTAEKVEKHQQFQEELGKFALMRERFANAVTKDFPTQSKRQVAMAMFTINIILSEGDRIRAKDANIVLFDERDLKYYEELVAHLGPAARYQFLADLLTGKPILGLHLRIPAIKGKIGGYTCYTFSISPEYLLKIAYVSHRAKGKASDVDTYQRMIKKPRLLKLRKYISEDGIFPTNVVINFDKRQMFERGPQDTYDQDSGTIGCLDIRPSYKSAWIIDGQHRLFAYSGHPRAEKSRLSILAFEGLPPSKQAELFIDINAEQKHVKQSLLQAMYAELNWNSDKPEQRISAVVSKSVQSAADDPESPFYGRILEADEKRDVRCCITLGSVFKALNHVELYLPPVKREGVVEYGPLWAAETEGMRKRTVAVLNAWFRLIQEAVPQWWDAGSDEGGGLSMNDGVTACIGVLRSVFTHLSDSGTKLATLDDEDLIERMKPYGLALGKYFAMLSQEERKRFRDLRGGQGITTRTRRCQQAIHEAIPAFDPAGLAEFLTTEKANTNTRAKAIADEIETTLQRVVLEELKEAFTLDDTQWWIEGVPKGIRLKVAQRHEDDDGKRGGREYYFDLLDYRQIIQANWELFGGLLGYAAAGAGKDKRTNWIQDVNEVRRIVAHVSAGRSVSLEQLAQVETYRDWLLKQVASAGTETAESA